MVKSRTGCRGIHIPAAAAEDILSFLGLDRISPVAKGEEEERSVVVGVAVDIDIPAAACLEDSHSRIPGYGYIYSPGGSSRWIVNQEEEDEDEIRSGAGIRVCVCTMTPS